MAGEIFFSSDLQRKLAKEMIMNSIECFVDMAMDCETPITTFEDAEKYLKYSKDQARDMLADQTADLQRQVEYYIENAVVQIKSVELDRDGLKDVTVDVTIEDGQTN